MPSAVDFESLLSDHLLADEGIAAIVGNKVLGHIDQKWIDELKKQGYHTELLEYGM